MFLDYRIYGELPTGDRWKQKWKQTPRAMEILMTSEYSQSRIYRMKIYRISDISDIVYGSDGLVSLKYRHLYRISDISDETICPEQSSISEDP